MEVLKRQLCTDPPPHTHTQLHCALSPGFSGWVVPWFLVPLENDPEAGSQDLASVVNELMGSLVEATGAHYDSFYVQHVGDEAVSYLLVLSAVQSIFFERKMETQLRCGLGQQEPRLPPPSPRDCWAQRLLPKATWVGDAQGCPGRSGMGPERRLAFVQLLGFPERSWWEGNHGTVAGRTFGS